MSFSETQKLCWDAQKPALARRADKVLLFYSVERPFWGWGILFISLTEPWDESRLMVVVWGANIGFSAARTAWKTAVVNNNITSCCRVCLVCFSERWPAQLSIQIPDVIWIYPWGRSIFQLKAFFVIWVLFFRPVKSSRSQISLPIDIFGLEACSMYSEKSTWNIFRREMFFTYVNLADDYVGLRRGTWQAMIDGGRNKSSPALAEQQLIYQHLNMIAFFHIGRKLTRSYRCRPIRALTVV